MTKRMIAALVRANEVAYRRWLEYTRLEEAVLGDPFLCGDEDAVFHRLRNGGGGAIQ